MVLPGRHQRGAVGAVMAICLGAGFFESVSSERMPLLQAIEDHFRDQALLGQFGDYAGVPEERESMFKDRVQYGANGGFVSPVLERKVL